MTTSSSAPGGSILSRSECFALVSTVAVGRFAWADQHRHVTIEPVNFAVFDGDVVFRCDRGEKLAAIRAGVPVAFEVDDLEAATHSGWSVLISGIAREVTDAAEAAEISHSLLPWGPGEHPFAIRLHPDSVSGRRLMLHRGGVSVVELAASDEEVF